MKVSVITITRNDMDGLQRTIDSVKSQNYENIEHIIVDADSSDGTKDLLAHTPGVTYVSEPDGGRYDGMNKGVKMSTGEVVWFMHSSDCFADREAISFVARQIQSSPQKFLWGYGLSAIVKDGQPIGIGGQVPFDRSKFLLAGKIVPHQASAYSKQFFEDLGGYRLDFGLAADQEFIARCCLKSQPSVWPRLLCIFDGHGAGSVRTLRAHFADMRKMRIDNHINVCGGTPLDNVIATHLMVATKVSRIFWKVIRHTESARHRKDRISV